MFPSALRRPEIPVIFEPSPSNEVAVTTPVTSIPDDVAVVTPAKVETHQIQLTNQH